MKRNIFLLVAFFLITIGTKVYSQEYKFSYYIERQITTSIPAHIDENSLTEEDRDELEDEEYTFSYCDKDDDLWLFDIGSLFDMDESTRTIFIEEFFGDFQIISEQDGIIVAVYNEDGDSLNLIINLNELTIEQRYYLEDEDNPFFDEVGNNLWGIHTIYFKEIDGVFIPEKEIEIDYDELESGIPYAYTDIALYLYYKMEGESDNTTIAETGDEELFNDCMGITTSITEIQANADMTVYPNPANERITVNLSSFTDENVNIEVFNMLGTKVLQHQVQGEQIDMDIHSLPAGVYIVRCTNMDKVITKRFVKQ